MTPAARIWTVRLTLAARADFRNIVRSSKQRFGEVQARTYVQTLSAAIGALSQGPQIVGVKRRDDIASGVFTLHVARQGRKGRHFVLFRAQPDGSIQVLRLMHDAMDLPRHADSLPDDDS